MKITKAQLKQIIKEELQKTLGEAAEIDYYELGFSDGGREEKRNILRLPSGRLKRLTSPTMTPGTKMLSTDLGLWAR